MKRYIRDFDSGLITNSLQPKSSEFEKKPFWFLKLKQSILENGILTAKDGKVTPRYGGCRIMFAKEMNIAKHAMQFFAFPPKKIIFKSHGINASGCKDIHMEDNDD